MSSMHSLCLSNIGGGGEDEDVSLIVEEIHFSKHNSKIAYPPKRDSTNGTIISFVWPA